MRLLKLLRFFSLRSYRCVIHRRTARPATKRVTVFWVQSVQSPLLCQRSWPWAVFAEHTASLKWSKAMSIAGLRTLLRSQSCEWEVPVNILHDQKVPAETRKQSAHRNFYLSHGKRFSLCSRFSLPPKKAAFVICFRRKSNLTLETPLCRMNFDNARKRRGKTAEWTDSRRVVK